MIGLTLCHRGIRQNNLARRIIHLVLGKQGRLLNVVILESRIISCGSCFDFRWMRRLVDAQNGIDQIEEFI
jgi:hypothetical protein